MINLSQSRQHELIKMMFIKVFDILRSPHGIFIMWFIEKNRNHLYLCFACIPWYIVKCVLWRCDKLYYKPLNLQIVPKDDEERKQIILKKHFHGPEGIGKGQNNFHHYILSKYLGITRDDVISFLKNQPEYQLFQNAWRQAVLRRSILCTLSPLIQWIFETWKRINGEADDGEKYKHWPR